MQKTILIIMMLCTLSTQVFGSIAYESGHSSQGDAHSLMHEIGQPHSHDHEDESEFRLSYSDEAIEHINEDLECCVVGLIGMSTASLSNRNPSSVVNFYASDWSPPFLKYIKPPPRH